MKSLIALWTQLADELASVVGTCTTRDIETVTGRFNNEGFSFFTITLPTFGKGLEKALDQGRVSHDHFPAFAFSGGLPKLFSGFLDLIFERRTGILLDDPSVDAIQAVRQLSSLFSKIELECAPQRISAAFDTFVQCEQEIRTSDRERTDDDLAAFHHVARVLFRDTFTVLQNKCWDGEVRGKHGPGATADKLTGNGKYRQLEWPDRLEAVFPYIEHVVPNARYYHEELPEFLEPGEERPVKVISVPKTMKTPRIIAIEPTAMQFMQQGIAEILVPLLEDNLDGMIGFRRQEPNQVMAKNGSETGTLATLDLSEASDRVSNQLVRLMLSDFRFLQEAVEATRSRKADVPGHGVIRLAKFSSMGSALCFPIEACVFLTCIFVGIQKSLGRQLRRSDVNRLVGSVRVYGDDLIVPVDSVPWVLDSLRTFGFKVNADKSFWTGKFRESCGKEYYDGQDVSIVKVRRVLPKKTRHAEEVLSTVSTRNQFYWSGLWHTAKWMDVYLTHILGHFPRVDPTSTIVGRESVFGWQEQKAIKIHKKLHSPRIKGWVPRSPLPKSKLSDQWALQKFFLKRSLDPYEKEHLQRAGRPSVVNLKLTRAQPF